MTRGLRLRDIAASLGTTEHSAYGIVADLAEAGYVVKQKDGRRNRYQLQAHLVGAGNRVTSCDLDIFADQSAEPIPPRDAHTGHFYGWVDAPGGRVLLQRPVRSAGVAVPGVLVQDQLQVPFAGDQRPVQALAAAAGNPSFSDSPPTRRQSRWSHPPRNAPASSAACVSPAGSRRRTPRLPRL